MKACNLHTNFGPYPNDRRKKNQEVITAVARSEVLTAMTMKVTVFWNVTTCSLIDIKGYVEDEGCKSPQNVGKYISIRLHGITSQIATSIHCHEINI
jgi:hypothetical protein